MGGRLVDYGIMSSSSNSEDEDYIVYTPTPGCTPTPSTPGKLVEMTFTKDMPNRNTMTRIPSEDHEYTYDDASKFSSD